MFGPRPGGVETLLPPPDTPTLELVQKSYHLHRAFPLPYENVHHDLSWKYIFSVISYHAPCCS